MADTQKQPAFATPMQKKNDASAANFLAIMILVSLIAVIVSGVLLKGRWSAFQMNQRVSGKETTTLDNLQADQSTYQNLLPTYQLYTADGRSKLIMDALPTSVDITALATALSTEADQSGVTLQSVSNDQAKTSATTAPAAAVPQQPAASTGQPIPVNITVIFSGQYAAVIHFLKTIEQSVRPIRVTKVTLGGGEGNTASANIQLTTYYAAKADLKPTTEVVK